MTRATRTLLATAAVLWLGLSAAGCYMNQGYLPVDVGTEESRGAYGGDIRHVQRAGSSGVDSGGGGGSCH
jgi:hypothetical protein